MYAHIISIYNTLQNEKTRCRWQGDGKMDNVLDRASVRLTFRRRNFLLNFSTLCI